MFLKGSALGYRSVLSSSELQLEFSKSLERERAEVEHLETEDESELI